MSREFQLDSMVRISGIVSESVVDGPGLRATIFFQGCEHACQGCHNPETWAPDGGTPLKLRELIPRMRLNPLITGITFSGGEPFYQAAAAAEFGGFLKSYGFNLWVYTGYTWEYLMKHSAEPAVDELLKVTDVLVDGPFQIAKKTEKMPFRGSSNQRLIKVPESMESGSIIQWQSTTLSRVKI